MLLYNILLFGKIFLCLIFTFDNLSNKRGYMKQKVLHITTLAVLTAMLSACGSNAEENGSKLVDKLNKSNTAKKIIDDIADTDVNKVLQNTETEAVKKYLADTQNQQATAEMQLAPLAFDKNNAVLFGGAGKLAYKDFLSNGNDNATKTYTANFASCNTDCNRADAEIVSGQMKFSIEYNTTTQAFEAKDITFSHLAKETANLSNNANSKVITNKVVTNLATQSTDLAVDNTKARVPAQITKDITKADQRVFHLKLVDAKVAGLPDFTDIQLVFSKNGGFVTSLNKDMVLAGVRTDNLPQAQNTDAIKATWNGYQLKVKGKQATKSDALTNFKFANADYPNSQLQSFGVTIAAKDYRGGYIKMGHANVPVYRYGYIAEELSGRIDKNAGIVVVSPNASFIAGTGNNVAIGTNSSINGIFIAQK